MMVCVLFLLSAQQVIPSKNRMRTPQEMADIIERFLDGKSRYPQEWNGFVEVSQWNKNTDKFRKRCDELDPLVNRPGDQDAEAVSELRSIIKELRKLGSQGSSTSSQNGPAEKARLRRRYLIVNSVCRLSLGLLFVLGNILGYVFFAPPGVPWYKAYGDFRFFIGVGCTIWGLYGFYTLRAETKRHAGAIDDVSFSQFREQRSDEK